MFVSIPEIFLANAEKQPDRLFIADPENAYSYSRAADTVLRTATILNKMGVSRYDRVAIHCSQDSAFLLTHLAVNIAGAICVPIENGASSARMKEIIDETETKLLISADPEAVSAAGCAAVSFSELLGQAENAEKISFISPAADDTSEILFTTGSTGKSKGIEVTYDNNLALAENICCGTCMRENNVEWIPLPLSHSHALRTWYANIRNSGSVVITNGVTNIALVYMMIKKYHATALDLSPSAAMILLRLSRGRFREFNETLDYIELGTSALSEGIKESLKKEFPGVRLYNCYGSTESGRSCTLDFSSSDDEPCCIGRPSVNARFIVVDDQYNEIQSSPTHTGRLACSGRMNMKGYWRQPGLTAETMRDGYVYTSDEAYIAPDGRVFMYGRMGDVITYKGIKIAPDEIEETVRKYGGIIEDCAVIPESDEAAGQIPVLVLKLKSAALDPNDLRSFLASALDTNKQPRKIITFNEIPRTYNGKLQRGKLKELLKINPREIGLL